jgi:zinc transporter
MNGEPVHARVLDGQGGARPATPAEIDVGTSDDGVLWLHFDYVKEGSAAWMRAHSRLDPVVLQALMADDPRPRSVVSGDGLLVILRGINMNDGADPEDMVSLRLWIEAHRVITLRHQWVASVQDVLKTLDEGHGPVDSGDILQEITDRMLARIGSLVEDIEDGIDQLEEQVLTNEGRELRARLSDLRRQSIALRRYIAPQRDMLTRLHTERVDWLSELARGRLRESADRVTRHVESLDAARERAAVTYEELSNRLAEQMNRTMYVLSIVAAIFLPLGLLTGLLGINVGGMPGADWPWAFAIVTVLLVLTGIGEWLWFRRARIL